ncbi:LytTR family transcriptional regulator DNA-binding domain-containing protein [Lewinella sp. LCG006]|uniref:LytTR family transcriptional regulator DNA-binding domain-containing protein n=1 Tax=Lewinella sp. LCG006 TaxID=3231911 RepID=UPI0034614EAD
MEETVIDDKWIFLFVYPLFVIFVCHVGNDNTLSQLLRLPSYYTDIVLAIICTYTAGIYWKKLFAKLDKRFDWYSNLKQRLIYQLILGFVLPILVIIGIEVVYLFLIDIKLSESAIFYLDLPMIAVLSLLINICYLFLYNRAHLMTLRNTNELPSSSSFQENFVVKLGTVILKIPIDEVAYFIIQEKITFLVTIEGKKYIYDFTLEQIMKKISPKEFFQLNRQVIARKNSIVKCKQTETRRLEITLTPNLPEPLFVAKTKSTKLLTWLNKY